MSYNSIKYFSQKETQVFWRSSTENLYSSLSVDYSGVSTQFIQDNEQIQSIVRNVINYSELDSGTLQPGLRMSIPGLIVFERPPSMQLVQYINNTVSEMVDSDDYCNCDDEDCESYHSDYSLEEVQSFYIPVPWQLYIATYSLIPESKYTITSVRMYFMNSPLNHVNVDLYAPYIPNFFANGLLCSPMFESSWEISRYPKDISGVIASAYDWVWNTGFNADLYECIQQTIFQSPNDFIKQHKKDFSFDERIAPSFYRQLSKLSIEEVVNMPWANPSYYNHFDSDLRSFIRSPHIYSIYLAETNKDPDTPMPDAYSEELIEFKEWIGTPSRFKKTYADILNNMFNPDSYPTSDKPQTNMSEIQDYNSLAKKIYTAISVANFNS